MDWRNRTVTPLEPQVRSKNEAAERLRDFITSRGNGKAYRDEMHRLLDAALAWERRRTVERIKEMAESFWSDEAIVQSYSFHPNLLFGWLRAILTESETSDE